MTRSIWYKRIRPRSGGLFEDAVCIAMLGLVVLGLGVVGLRHGLSSAPCARR